MTIIVIKDMCKIFSHIYVKYFALRQPSIAPCLTPHTP